MTPDWMAEAQCKGMETAIFYPSHSGWHDAEQLCQGCPVITECLDYAIENNIDQGVWGGQSERARRRIRRARKKVHSSKTS